MAELIGFLPEAQRQLTLRDGIELQISRSKQDDLFKQFSDQTSDIYDFVEKVASNDILRCLFFFRSEYGLSVGHDYRISLTIPILLDYDCDLMHFLEEREDIKQLRNNTKKRYDSLNDELNTLVRSTLFKYCRTIFADPRIMNAIRSRSVERFSTTLERIFEEKRDRLFEIFRIGLQIYPKISELTLLEQIIKFTALAQNAQSNSKTLKLLLDIKNRTHFDRFRESLGKLASRVELQIETLCLHCFYREGDNNPYHCLIENPKEIRLDISCPKCHGPGLIHLLRIQLPFRVGKLVYSDYTGLRDPSWLNEFLIGFAASKLDFVDLVIIHKKLHRIKDSVQKGSQVDVALITKDRKLIILEVTRQHALDNLVSEAARKKKRLDELEIPYDLMFYVTSHGHEISIPLEDKAFILGVKHIYKLNDVINYHYEKIQSK